MTKGRRGYLSLLKLRIGILVTFSAVVAALAATPERVPARTVLILALATALASAGSGTLNHYFDRDLDGLMERTRDRPLPTGRVRPLAALGMGLTLTVGGLSLGLALNVVVSLYLTLGVAAYVVLYTIWLKRRSPWNIVIGGLAGSFAVLAGAAAVRPDLSLTAPALALASILFMWTPPHFWSLAIAINEEYRRAGIPMLPVVMGERAAARWILIHTVLLVEASLLLHRLGSLGAIYLLGAIGVGAFFFARNLQLLVCPSLQRSRRSFHASLVYLALLLLVLLADVMLRTIPGEAAAQEWLAPPEAKRIKNPVPAADGVKKAKSAYEQNCAICHGAGGEGDGPAAAALNPKPKRLADPAIQRQTDGEIFWKISEGRGIMPPWRHLSEEERWALVHYIRSLGKKQ